LRYHSNRFVQLENFRGILVPLLGRQLNTRTRRGFEPMNEKIKELAEKEHVKTSPYGKTHR
jgi:hypothetical protein